MEIIGRRGFLAGIGGVLIAAPAIVRATSLMQLRGIPLAPEAPRFVVPSFQEFIVRGWDQFGMPTTETIRLSEDQVRNGEWEKYYGHNAQFAVDGEHLARHQNDWKAEGEKYLSEHRSLWDEPPLGGHS
jgi:hypothetical protein